jgi:hypothetical protein
MASKEKPPKKPKKPKPPKKPPTGRMVKFFDL